MNCSAQEIYTLLRHYDKILLTAHVSPDGDAIGSLLALWHWLQLQGKKAVMVIDDDIDDRYDFLDGLQYINKPDQVETDDSWPMRRASAASARWKAWSAARSSTSTTIFPMSTSPSGNTSGPTARRRGKS